MKPYQFEELRLKLDLRLERSLRVWLRRQGLDKSNLKETPRRWVKMMKELTAGYGIDTTLLFKTFSAVGYDQMIVCGPIKFYSICEHHLAPFKGAAWLGYLPNKKGRIIGLSKLARLVSAHAKRFQVQEGMTFDIAHEMMTNLEPLGVGVRIESEHSCMAARGAEKEGVMRTQSLLGVFREAEVRAEFYNLCMEHGK